MAGVLAVREQRDYTARACPGKARNSPLWCRGAHAAHPYRPAPPAAARRPNLAGL